MMNRYRGGEANPFDILLFCVLLLYSKPKFNYCLFVWDISIQVLILPCFWAHFVTLNTFQRYFDIRNQVIWSSVLYSEQPVSGQILKGPLSLSHLTFLLPWIKDITRQESKLSADKKNTACSGRDGVMWLSSNDRTSGGSNFQNPFLSPESSSNMHQRCSWGSSCILNIFIFGRYLWEIIEVQFKNREKAQKHNKEQRIWFRYFFVSYVSCPKV